MRRTSILLAVLLTGCSLAPSHQKPTIALPDKYKEGGAVEGRWQLASKNPGQADSSAWWTIFKDPKLNQLEQAAIKENNSLKSAAARLEQSRAALRQTTASFYPRVDATANASRFDIGRDASPTGNFGVGAMVSYDVNTLIQINDAATGSKANTLAAEALYRQALLMVQADVADNYFALLSLDTERDLLSKTIDLRIESQNLIEKRFKEGEAGEQDLLRAKAETTATQADLKALDQQRAIREHALAVLTGNLPSAFTLEDASLPTALPRVPAGLPSSLLERRPDIAAAEYRMIQTNAQIGIARAAFFPNIALTASGGLAAPDLGDIFSWSSRSWALGPLFGNALSLPIFDAGRRLAGVDLAKGRYQESVSDYRQQVLVAFKDVEDALSSLRLQAEQADHLYASAEAATRASRISDLRYKEGETSYLEVLDTQRDTLSVQRAYTQVQGARFRSTVGLVRALGGGWISVTNTFAEQAIPVPKEKAVEQKQPRQVMPQTILPSKQEKPDAIAPVAGPTPVPLRQQAPAPTIPQRDFKDINPAILFD